nr:hypothetical protein [Kibdelosporangium sp. MJ126-NF4]CTQ90016.1 hypothetical protein [Kibdelosporangium sp. MJ126-NF4]
MTTVPPSRSTPIGGAPCASSSRIIDIVSRCSSWTRFEP